ncbi:hypothetical protein SELMODRAFT_17767, partial [Selaginella moellendorffii]
ILYLHNSCNLVLYIGKYKIWSTKTSGHGKNCKLRLQSNGKLGLYSEDGIIVWSPNNKKCLNCFLNIYFIVQNDCNLVLYQS